MRIIELNERNKTNLLESLFMVAISCMIVWTGRKLPVIRYLF